MIVGAAAWIPQVIGWVARLLTKPEVRVIPSRTSAIGHTSLGPIFNLSCAISADRKDAVIERMTATLVHERGQSTEFRWITLNETLSQTRTMEGITEVSKNQPAVTLKVSTLVLTEKQIGMQERGFEEETRGLVNALTSLDKHLRKTEPDKYQDLILKSREFADMVEYAKKRFIWQDGRYAVRLQLRIVGVKEPTVQRFQFVLSKNDVERLQQNLDEIERYARNLVQPPKATPLYTWNWVYPPFTEETLPAKRARYPRVG